MKENKNKQQALLKYLQALRSKDLKKIQKINLDPAHQCLINDINGIMKEYIQLKRKNTEMHNQLVDQRRRNQDLQEQNSKLRNLIKDNKPIKNQKGDQSYSKVINLFASDKLQASAYHANSSQLKVILRNLWEYRQLKFTFCQNTNKNKINYREIKNPSAVYNELKRRLNQRIKQPNQIHNMYAKILPKLYQKNEQTMKLLSKFPPSIKCEFQKIINHIQQLKQLWRDVNECAEQLAVNGPQDKKVLANKIMQSCIFSSYKQRVSVQQNDEQIDYQGQRYWIEQKEVFYKIKEKIKCINKIINTSYKSRINIIKTQQQQAEQCQVLENVITLLNTSPHLLQKCYNNTQTIEQGNEDDSKVKYQSLQTRQKQLQDQQIQLKHYLVEMNHLLLDGGQIENIISIDMLDKTQRNDMEQLKNLLKVNVGLLIDQYKSNRNKIQEKSRIKTYSPKIQYRSTDVNRAKIFVKDEFQTQNFEQNQNKQQLKQQIERLSSENEKNIDSLTKKENIIKQGKAQIQMLTNQIQDLKNKLNMQGGKMKKIQRQKSTLEKSMIKLSKIYNTSQIYSQENNEQSQQIQSLKKQLRVNSDKLDSVSHQLLQINKQLQHKTKVYQQLKINHNQLQQQVKTLKRQKINLLDQHIKQIQSKNLIIQQKDQLINFYRQREDLSKQNHRTEFSNIKQQNHKQQQCAQSSLPATQEVKTLKLKIKDLQNSLQIVNKQLKLKAQQLVSIKQQLSIKLASVQSQLNKKYNDLLNQSATKTKQILQFQQKLNKSQTLLKQLQQKYNELTAKQRQLQIPKQEHSSNQDLTLENNRFNQHLFNAGDIFDDYYQEQRLQLIRQLANNLRPIKRTKLIYKFDTINRVNFHKYIDNHKHIVLVIKTLYSKIIAAYSQQCFNQNGTKKGNAFLMSLQNGKIYYIIKDKKGVTYDDYFLIFGNSQIRIKALESKFFSNFGVSNSFFDHRGDKMQQFVGEKVRELDLLTYQLYELQFQQS